MIGVRTYRVQLVGQPTPVEVRCAFDAEIAWEAYARKHNLPMSINGTGETALFPLATAMLVMVWVAMGRPAPLEDWAASVQSIEAVGDAADPTSPAPPGD